VVIGLGGVLEGVPRETGFDITPASEVMAALCLAEGYEDLRARLARIVVALAADRRPVTAADLKAVGAMMVLLKDAMKPNLVQTLEGGPAIVHGGPFANIATAATRSWRRRWRSRAPTGRDRGRVRVRPGRGEILRHQVASRPASTPRPSARRHRARLKLHGGANKATWRSPIRTPSRSGWSTW